MSAVRSPLRTARLRPDSLREQAARSIRSQIIAGEIAAGELYPIGYFATRFGVSPTPVRDALSDLAHEGLVKVVRNRGFRIVEVSEEDVDQALEVRQMLEVPATVQVAGRLSAADIEISREYVRQVEEFAMDGDVTGYVDAERSFHLHLLEIQGNRRIIEIVSRLRDQERLYNLRALTRSVPYMRAAAPEHREILDALIEGDAAHVESVMRRHLTQAAVRWTARADEAE